MFRVFFLYVLVITLSLEAGNGILSPPPSVFSHTETATYSPQIPKVNVITGEYHEEEVDFVVAGCEPLSIRRFYNHLGHKNQAYGHWSINPEALVLFELDSKYPKSMGFGEEGGNFIQCDKQQDKTFLFDAQKHNSFTNMGANHPLNTCITFRKVAPKKSEYYLEGTIKDGLGGKKLYRSEIGKWSNALSSTYQACVREEHKPNGNIIRYEYEDFNHKFRQESRYKNLSSYYVLTAISAYSSTGFPLGTIYLKYSDKTRKANPKTGTEEGRFISGIAISGSDERYAQYRTQIRKVQEEKKFRIGAACERPELSDVVLTQVESSHKPIQCYDYRWDGSATYFEHPYLYSSGESRGALLHTSYDLNSEKVSQQSAPIGLNGKMLPIARYEYGADHTCVYDSEDEKTIYHFNKNKRITSIEKYDGPKLVQVKRNEWDPTYGNLLKHQIEDEQGTPLLIQEYTYDNRHNPRLEKIGDGKQWHVTTRAFSSDAFNLLEKETTKENRKICYAYVPNTNLPLSQFEKHHEKIVKRTFHIYDPELNSVCIRTVVDDGQTKDPNNLRGVTYRKILEVVPRKEAPCVGLPREVREKTLDAYGKEILLHRTCYTYHPSGKISQEDHFDANNTYRYSIKNTYDAKERLIATIDALGHITHFDYDDDFNLISKKGPVPDAHKEWEYDAMNRPIKEKDFVDGNILVTEKEYDRCSRLIAQTNPCHQTTQYNYDALGRCIEVVYPDGATEKREYDALGNVIKKTDPLGNSTTYTYNFRSQVLSVTYPDGGQEDSTYDSNGLRLTHTNRVGTKTNYTYDLFDNCIQTDTYSSQGELLTTISATYSPFSKLSETDAAGVTTFYSYDFAGRLIGKRLGDRVTTYSYDSLGQLSATQEGDTLTSQTFDVKGQLLEKRVFSNQELLFKENYAYDALGNQTEHTTAGGITKTTYNSLSQPVEVEDPLGHQTQISYSYTPTFSKKTLNPLGVAKTEVYNNRGLLSESYTKNASGKTIQRNEKVYDLSGQLIENKETVYHKATPKREVSTKCEYDSCGRQTKRLEADSKETLFFYNSAGLLSKTIKPDKTEISKEYDALGRLSHLNAPGLAYQYRYDKVGNLLFAGNCLNSTERVYDIYGNTIEEHLANGLSLNYFFDPYGRRERVVFPDDSEVKYSYKGPYLNQITRKGQTHTYTQRNLAGLPTHVMLPDATTLHIDWDPLLRWKKIDSPYYKATYTYDALGNLTKRQSTDALGDRKEHYAYDDLNQLIQETAHSYQYDSLYNRLAKDNASYEINALNQLIGEYIYDSNGNLTFDGITTYEYDALDRLTSVRNVLGQWEYTYDAFNRRTSKIGPQVEEQYIWDGKQEIGAYDRGNLQELRILGEGFSEIGGSVFIERGEKNSIPIHDIQGSIIALVTDGQTHGVHRYTAFGEQPQDDKVSPWCFAGKRLDEETGFIYFGRRYYSPSLGRWITPDPLESVDGLNLYAYIHNSPFTLLDLHGLFSLRSLWGGTKDAGVGAGTYAWDMVQGVGKGFMAFSEWMGADIAYEMDEPSYFYAKSNDSCEGWKAFGSALRDEPLKTTGETFVPGLMEAFQNPTSAASWGKAAVDIGLIAMATTKIGQTTRMANASKISETVVSSRRASRMSLMQATSGIKSNVETANIVHLEKRISSWLGKSARFIKNEAGDAVFLSEDGLRRVRFDFKNPHPHHNPHAHVEVKTNDLWVKSGPIYPTDVPHN